jgi:excisionase family DNA binding protein
VTSNAPSPLLTLAETAKLLKISTRHLARVISAGDLPVVRVTARVVRISPADLDAYIEGKREVR